MPWNKAALLRQIRAASRRKDVDRAELRQLEQLARQYGATRAEIAKAKGSLPKRRKRS